MTKQIPTLLGAFAAGLTRPSWTALVTAAVTILALAIAALAVDEKFVADHLGPYLPAGPRDLDAVASMDAIRMHAAQSRTPLLVLLGGSATNQAFLETSAIQERLNRAGLEMEVARLTTDRQSLWEAQAFVDKIPGDRKAIIVLGIGLSRFTWSRPQYQRLIRRPRLGFRSDAIDAEAVLFGINPQKTTGFYVIDNRQFLVPRIVEGTFRYLAGKPTQIVRFPNLETIRPPQTLEEWRIQGAGILKRMEGYDQKYLHNIAVLGRLVSTVRDNPNWQFILIEHPINDNFVDEFLGKSTYASFVAKLEAFGNEHDVPFWRLPREAGLTPDDYRDWAHIDNGRAQEKCTDVLVTRISETLEADN